MSRLKLIKSKKECTILQKHNHDIQQEQTTEVSGVVEVEEGKTNRGGTFLLNQGNSFIKCSGGKEIYRCSKYVKHCRARIRMNNGKAYLTNDHNHE